MSPFDLTKRLIESLEMSTNRQYHITNCDKLLLRLQLEYIYVHINLTDLFVIQLTENDSKEFNFRSKCSILKMDGFELFVDGRVFAVADDKSAILFNDTIFTGKEDALQFIADLVEHIAFYRYDQTENEYVPIVCTDPQIGKGLTSLVVNLRGMDQQIIVPNKTVHIIPVAKKDPDEKESDTIALIAKWWFTRKGSTVKAPVVDDYEPLGDRLLLI